MSRLKAMWQQNGAGQNMARYINLRRRHALSEKGEGEEGWFGMNSNVGEGVRQNASGAFFDLTGTALEVAGRIGSSAEEGDFSLLFKNSDLDERVLNSTNEQSLEYLVNHNIARSAGDFLTYEAAYWAIPTIVTGGVAGAVGTKSMALGATLKSPTLIRAGMFLKPTLSGGKAVVSSSIAAGSKGKLVTSVVKPATGFFGRQKLVQGINMVKSGAKTTLISDLPLAAFSNLQEDGRGMIQEDGFFQTLFEQYPESAMFAPQIAQGINSPLFKQLDFIVTETAYGTLGVVGIGGFGQSIFTQGAKKLGKLPEVPGQITRWGQKNMDQLAVSTKSWSTKIDSEFVNQKYWFPIKDKQELKKQKNVYRNLKLSINYQQRNSAGDYLTDLSAAGTGELVNPLIKAILDEDIQAAQRFLTLFFGPALQRREILFYNIIRANNFETAVCRKSIFARTFSSSAGPLLKPPISKPQTSLTICATCATSSRVISRSSFSAPDPAGPRESGATSSYLSYATKKKSLSSIIGPPSVATIVSSSKLKLNSSSPLLSPIMLSSVE